MMVVVRRRVAAGRRGVGHKSLVVVVGRVRRVSEGVGRRVGG